MGVQDGCLLAQVTLWMMCVERCLVQLSTLQLKEAFLQPKGKSSTSSDPAPSPPPNQLLPAPLPPWPRSKCFMWPDRARSEVDTPAPSSEETCFPAGRERVGVGGVEQKGGGVHLFHFHLGGGWVNSSHGTGGNRSAGALSHAPGLACVHL